ncbi:MAG TPA: VRR-NUC domain-containing protein [Pyrinomonadaceae bacterium]|jgi:hypothetical protein
MSKNKNLSGGLFAAKPTPLTQTESSISAQVKEYLDARGIYNDRLQCGRIRTANGHWIVMCETGTPDRLAIVRGQAVFIETKTRGKKPSSDQLIKHDELRNNGALVIVADSFEQFKQQFSAIRAAIEENARKGNLYD